MSDNDVYKEEINSGLLYTNVPLSCLYIRHLHLIGALAIYNRGDILNVLSTRILPRQLINLRWSCSKNVYFSNPNPALLTLSSAIETSVVFPYLHLVRVRFLKTWSNS